MNDTAETIRALRAARIVVDGAFVMLITALAFAMCRAGVFVALEFAHHTNMGIAAATYLAVVFAILAALVLVVVSLWVARLAEETPEP